MFVLVAVLAQLIPGLPIGPQQLPSDDPYYPAKVRPTLAMKVRPKADATKPYRFTMSGKLQLNGVDPSAGCRGRITIRMRRGDITVAKGRVNLGSDCRFSKRLTLNTSKLPAKEKVGGVLRVSGRFSGNEALQAASAPQRKAAFGTRLALGERRGLGQRRAVQRGQRPSRPTSTRT